MRLRLYEIPELPAQDHPFFLLPVRMANIAGNEYVYREIGSGQPILALPGLWTTSLTFRNLIEPLGDSCHLALPELLDPAGHNLLSDGDYSPEGLAELILQIIEGLGLEKVVLVGHGESGLACLWLALTQPARIHSVVVIASAIRLTPWQVLKGYWQGRAQSIYWAKAAFLQPDRAALAMLQFQHQAPGIISRQEMRYVGACWKTLPGALARARILSQSLRTVYRKDFMQLLESKIASIGGLTVPLTLIYGKYDRLAPPEHGQKLNRLFTGSELHIGDCGGMVQVEEAQWTAEIIKRSTQSVR